MCQWDWLLNASAYQKMSKHWSYQTGWSGGLKHLKHRHQQTDELSEQMVITE